MTAGQANNWIILELPGLATNVGVARVAVAAFAAQLEFTLNDLEDIKLAVSEAVSNAVLHAYPPGEPGTVRIRAALVDGELELTVEDRGRGIDDVDRARQTGFSTLPDRMGMGFVFMEAFMDLVEVASRPGEGTTVRMRKRVGSEPRAEVPDQVQWDFAGAGPGPAHPRPDDSD